MESTFIATVKDWGVPPLAIYALIVLFLIITLWSKVRDIGIDIIKLVRKMSSKKSEGMEQDNADPASTSSPASATSLAERLPLTEGEITLTAIAVNLPYFFIVFTKNPVLSSVPSLIEPFIHGAFFGVLYGEFAIWLMKRINTVPTFPKAIIFTQIPIMVIMTVHGFLYLQKLIR